MKKIAVLIKSIRQTANNTWQLQLTQDIQRVPNLVGILMEGHAGFVKPKPRVAFVTVSDQQMQKYAFKEGDNFGEKLGMDINLQVTEGYTPFGKRKDEQGNLVDQLPKMNPTTREIMKKDGKPIYRTCEAVVKSFENVFEYEKTSLIQHDSQVVAQPLQLPAKAMKANVLAD